MRRLWGLIIVLLLFSGCATIRAPDMEMIKSRDFGAAESLRICIYKDVEISHSPVLEIISAMRKEFVPFGLNIEIPWIRAWERPAFTADGIINDLAFRPLEAPCDRVVALVSRNFADFFWGMIMPEVVGAVEDITLTKGFAVAEIGSINQLLNLQSLSDAAIHETYHFLGCDHECDQKFTTDSCYDQIICIKKAARDNREAGRNFFPAMTLDGKILWTREEVEKQFGLRH